MHVLPRGFHRIRHYGLLASGNRATKADGAVSSDIWDDSTWYGSRGGSFERSGLTEISTERYLVGTSI
jgi:hypothetical protein